MNAEQPEPQQQEGQAGMPPPLSAMPKQITYWQFGFKVVPLPAGNRALVIETPQGEAIILPFGPDAAGDCGKQLSAPSVVLPGPNGRPS